MKARCGTRLSLRQAMKAHVCGLQRCQLLRLLLRQLLCGRRRRRLRRQPHGGVQLFNAVKARGEL